MGLMLIENIFRRELSSSKHDGDSRPMFVLRDPCSAVVMGKRCIAIQISNIFLVTGVILKLFFVVTPHISME